MQQPLVDVVQGIRHNLVVMKQQALVAGYGASIGHNFVVMEQQVFRITKWFRTSFCITLQLWSSKHRHNCGAASFMQDEVAMEQQPLSVASRFRSSKHWA